MPSADFTIFRIHRPVGGVTLRVLVVAVAWLLFAAGTAGAQAFSGEVRDTDGTALPSAQVLLRSGEDILAYTMTDATGKFSLDLPSDTTAVVRFEVRYFGYDTFSQPLTEARAQSIFTLRAGGVDLREVVVAESALPIVRRRDTLVYTTAAYTDGDERKVEDMLRKLPGVEVSEEGEVKVGGREIDRILVEGQDAFGKNYKMASKNINADLVGHVEVIENHTDDPLTDDLSGEEELVLNLDFTRDGQNVLFGEVKGAVGNGNATETDANAFLLGARRTLALFGQTNTLGRQPSSATDLRAKTGEQILPAGDLSPEGLLRPVAGNAPRALNTEDYLNNNALSAAGSALLQPSDKVRSRVLFAADRQEAGQEQLQQSTRLTGSGPLTIDQIDQYTSRGRNFWLEADNRFTISPTGRLDVNLKGTEVTGADDAALNSSFGDTTDDALETNLSGRERTFSAAVRQTFRTGDQTALRFGGEGHAYRLTQLAEYRSERYAALPRVGTGFAEQTVSRSENRMDAFAEFLAANKKNNFRLRAGHREKGGRLTGELADSSSILDYRLRENYLSATLRRKADPYTAELGAEVADAHLTYANGVNTAPVDRRIIGRVNGSLTYRVTPRGHLTAGAGTDRRLPRPNDLLGGPYLSDYQTLTTGLTEPYLIRTHSVFARYAYQNIFRQFSYQLSYNQGWSPNGLGGVLSAEGPLLLRSLRAGFPSGTRRLAARAEKYIKPISANVRLGADVTDVRSQLDLGAIRGLNVYRITRLYGRYQTRLLGSVKASLGYEYRVVTNKLAAPSASETGTSVHAEQIKGLLSWKPAEQWYLATGVRHYSWRLTGRPNAATLWDITARHEFDDRWSVGLRGLNLLNQADVQLLRANPLLTTRRVIPLRGRTLLLEITYAF